MEDNKKREQIEIAERLQTKLLKRFETLLDEGAITSTDLATLARLLMSNGWTLDITQLPDKLRNKVTAHIKPEDLVEDEATLRLYA